MISEESFHPGKLTSTHNKWRFGRWFSFSNWVNFRFQPFIFRGVVQRSFDASLKSQHLLHIFLREADSLWHGFILGQTSSPTSNSIHNQVWFSVGRCLPSLANVTKNRFRIPSSISPEKGITSCSDKTHTIHVWYTYLHLVDFFGKCSSR